MLGARCGESRSPALSPGSKEPRRETGPAAMGHPPWGSSMDVMYVTYAGRARRGWLCKNHSLNSAPYVCISRCARSAAA